MMQPMNGPAIGLNAANQNPGSRYHGLNLPAYLATSKPCLASSSMCFNHIGHGRLKPDCVLLACLDSQLHKKTPPYDLIFTQPVWR